MDETTRVEMLIALAGEMGIAVRQEPLGGQGGGICTLRGQKVLFIDTSADPVTRYETTVSAMANVPGIDELYVRPELREDLERFRTSPP